MTKIKICGLFRPGDIDYVNQAKPDYIGFILNFKKSHRFIEPKEAVTLRKSLDPSIKAVGVFVDEDLKEVIKASKLLNLNVIQLHGHEDNDYIEVLKESTDIPVWKAFKVRSEEDLVKANSSLADMVILDNGYGTGECFDWSLITHFRREFILAGGLTPENIEEAVSKFTPYCVDISSGAETDKRKDKEKIIKAVNAVRNTQKGGSK